MLLEDVEYFLEKAKAKECFEMLDLDRDGKISLQVHPCCTLRYDLCCMLRYEMCCMLRYCLCNCDLPPTLSPLQVGPEQQNWSRGAFYRMLRYVCFQLSTCLSLPCVGP